MSSPAEDYSRQAPYGAPEIFAGLHKQVVGQIPAKRDLATLLAMHLEWFSQPDDGHTAPNALIIGPTGVGKTHAIRTAAKTLSIPLAIVDATRLGAFGGGDTLEDVLIELLSASRRLMKEGRLPKDAGEEEGLPGLDEVDVARRGIVFIDEFDKLAIRGRTTSERNELMQRRLLQFVDGTTITLNPTPDASEAEVSFNTAGLLFIVAGAFTDLTSDPGERSQETMRGLDLHDHVIPEDLVRFGFMKELIARVPVIIEFTNLIEADLQEILRTPEVNPAIFYTRYLASLGTDLVITDEAREWIASNAESLKIGARGLHQVMFPLLALLSQEVEEEHVSKVVLDLNKLESLSSQLESRRRGK